MGGSKLLAATALKVVLIFIRTTQLGGQNEDENSTSKVYISILHLHMRERERKYEKSAFFSIIKFAKEKMLLGSLRARSCSMQDLSRAFFD